jgi:hypothetical protein
MFDRISASFTLARNSWDVLRQDKKLLIFPILSGIGCFLVLASFIAPLAVIRPAWLDALLNNANGAGGNAGKSPWPFVLAFAFYFCNYFVIVFCNAALISCALIRFNGGEPTIGDGINAAVSRLPQILAWALVSATVGIILKAIENGNEKVGRFISAILGTAWAVMTFFVVPVLVVEKVGPVDAVKRSISILKKTWGEALVGQFGIGLFMFLLAIPGIIVFGIGAVLAAAQPVIGVPVLLLGLVYFLLLGAISSAMHGIYLGALYQYATHGSVPGGFDGHVLERAFKRK